MVDLGGSYKISHVMISGVSNSVHYHWNSGDLQVFIAPSKDADGFAQKKACGGDAHRVQAGFRGHGRMVRTDCNIEGSAIQITKHMGHMVLCEVEAYCADS